VKWRSSEKEIALSTSDPLSYKVQKGVYKERKRLYNLFLSAIAAILAGFVIHPFV